MGDKEVKTNDNPVEATNTVVSWNKIQNLLRRIQDGIVNLERPLGGPRGKLVYDKCPKKIDTQSSLDFETGRGPVVQTSGGKDCPKVISNGLSTEDPIGFLRQLQSKSKLQTIRDTHMLGDAALKTCENFTNKDACVHGKIDSRTLQPQCKWANQKCTDK